MKKKKLKLKEQFYEAADYIRESKKYIYFSVVLFLIFAFIGFVFRGNLSFIDELLKRLIEQTAGLNLPEMIFFILQNNLQSALLSVIAGVFLGVIPLMNIISNGTVIGYVLGKTYDAAGLVSWWRLLPHGVFELPAIFISFGLGVKLGYGIFRVFIKRVYRSSRIVSFLPALLGLVFSLAALQVYNSTPEIFPELPLAIIVGWTFVSVSFILYLALVLIYYFTDKKMSEELNKFAKLNVYDALNALLFVVIPLLVLAAIIEGVLIIFLG